ncbi:SH3 domain-containing protein [Acetobacter sp. TBRC 12305]|uniref:SH3 domain-containing protein n=1 Tax=Acetobacter garciniae TaxID=2817435 RepID=A0A939KRE8_9PROT|nr:hypothetical protein [Acetobacter garciniae]MBO1326829.1 hypothetical protein [Acetobacter garciniae]MBX0345965.1 SH3 domain-containing protein [Acetobacter garciniae]
MSSLTTAALAVALLATCATSAMAQSFSPAELDRMAQERQREIGPRNWGPPVAAKPDGALIPLPGPAACMSPRTDFEPVYAGPGTTFRKAGVAAPQLAVSTTRVNGWAKIYRAGGTSAWIPEGDLVPYRPSLSDHPTGCKVDGIRPADRMVIFSYPVR